MKRLKRITGILIVVVFCTLFLIRLAIPIAVPGIANRMVPDILGTGFSMSGLNLSLLRGYFSLDHIQVEQPDGFGSHPLFVANNIIMDVDNISLVKKPITMETISISNIELNIIRDKDGKLNISQLAGNKSPADSVEEILPKETETASPPAVTLHSFEIKSMTISFQDFSIPEKPLSILVRDIHLSATELNFDPLRASETTMPGSLLVTAIIEQPEFQNGFIGLFARTGILGMTIPALNAAIRISGFELGTVSSLLPPGIGTALGGSCLDTDVDVFLAADVLNIKARVETDGHTLHLAVGGTPASPQIDKSGALFNLLTRPGAMAVGVANDVAGASAEAGKTVFKTASAAGRGAFGAVGSVGKGVFKTAKGIVTADVKEMGEGLKTATVGTVTKTIDTVTDVASTAVSGVVDTASTVTGMKSAANWRSQTVTRWNQKWSKAQKDVNAAPYPQPTTTAKRDAQIPQE